MTLEEHARQMLEEAAEHEAKAKELRAGARLLKTAKLALQQEQDAQSTPKPRRTRADKGKPRKAAKVKQALDGQTNYEGPDGQPVAGVPDFVGDKPADWCPAQGSQVSASGCESRQDINPAGCPVDCQRRKKA